MNFKVFTTEEYDKKFKKFDKNTQIQIDSEIESLQDNPYSGKPLGYKFFREKKVKGFRIYYLIYDEYVVVFVISISEKKYQQEAINKIKRLIPSYREEIKKRINS